MRNEVVPQGGAVRPDWLGSIPAGRLLAGAVALCAAAASACAGPGRTQVGIGPPPPRETHAVLAGALCQDNHCSCRRDEPGDGGVGLPDTGRKRYEIRMTSPQELWLTINRSTVLYKSPERVEDCFYVDLASGSQELELRASNPDGVSAGLQIHELGTRTRSWYDTFTFRCGIPGVCSFEELDAQKADYTGKHNLFDRCGTTKIKGLSWDHGKAPDQLHPSELVVRLTLDIYKFAAWKQHGDDTCGMPGQGRPPADEPRDATRGGVNGPALPGQRGRESPLSIDDPVPPPGDDHPAP